MKAAKFLPTSSITLDEFASLLMDDTDLLPESKELLSAIFHELRLHVTTFSANTPELVQLAALHSTSFACLPAGQQASLSGMLTMPIFFCGV
ncbi:hypothetical protein [Pectobacterium versatile]|uniref:hypothetical protein n=1 Tax=Pectobacterium versatile TaxID=2488639 RepID=UPI003016FE19